MSLAEELERLQQLRAQGALSEAEFQQAKARVIGSTADPIAPDCWRADISSPFETISQ